MVGKESIAADEAGTGPRQGGQHRRRSRPDDKGGGVGVGDDPYRSMSDGAESTVVADVVVLVVAAVVVLVAVVMVRRRRRRYQVSLSLSYA